MNKTFLVIVIFITFGFHAHCQTSPIKKDTIFNSANYLVTGPLNGNIKVVKKGSENKHPAFQTISKYQNDLVLSDNLTFEQVEIYKKYRPIASFDDYPVSVFKGALAEPDFKSNPGAKMFITRIKAACQDGINFAGHYTLVEWGCGTACQSGVIVDRKTGEIHDRPTSSLGMDFKPDSNMVIFNIGAVDLKTNLISISGHSEVRFELFDGSAFTPIK